MAGETTFFDGFGEQKVLAERARTDINGKSLELTIAENLVTAIGGVSVAGSGSETNIIETVEVEGTPLTVTNKTVNVTKTDLSLNNVTNDSQVKRSEMGAANGVATLDAYGHIPSNQIPGSYDDVRNGYYYSGEFYFDAEHTQIMEHVDDILYVDVTTNIPYRWTGTTYTRTGSDLSLGTTEFTAYRGDHGLAAYEHSLVTSGNPHNVTKSDIGLGNVDNTSDSTKKSNFTGSIADSDTGFVTGGDVYTALSGKVDAVSGKGLSTNDYTTAEKEKVAIIPTGASAVSSLTCTSANTYAWAGWTNKTVKVLGRIVALYNGISNRGLDITSGSFGAVARDTSGPLEAPDGLGMPYYNRRNFGSTDVISMHDEFKSIFASNNFTIDFWVKLSGGSNNDNQGTIIRVRNDDNSNNIYAIYESYYSDPGCVTHGSTGRISLATSKWHHIAYVSNSQTNQSKLYINGTLTRTTNISSIIFTDIDRVIFMNYGSSQLNSNLQCYLAQFTVRDYPVWTSDFTPPTIMY